MQRFVGVLVLYLCGCMSDAERAKSSEPEESVIFRQIKQVGLTHMEPYTDDGVNTVYFRGQDHFVSAEELVARKQAWHEKFPWKRIVAMTAITGSQVYGQHYSVYASAGTAGLLVHYEIVAH